MMDTLTKNETLVDRLMAEGSDLSLEAAEKIEALRRRGHFWERATHAANRKWMHEVCERIRWQSQHETGL